MVSPSHSEGLIFCALSPAPPAAAAHVPSRPASSPHGTTSAGIRSCHPVPPSHRARGPAAGGKYENMLPHARTAILFAPASSALLSSAEQKRSRQYHQNRTAGQEDKLCVQSQFPKPIAPHFAAKKDSRFRGCLKWKSGAGPEWFLRDRYANHYSSPVAIRP